MALANDKKLEGKISLITGAGRGIGRATAKLFAEHDSDLVLVSRTKSELEQTAKICSEFDVDIMIRPTDLSSSDEIGDLFIDLLGRFPQIDILVNNAGIFHSGLTENIDLESFREVMRVNVEAPLLLSQKMLKTVDSENGGCIVNVSSYSGCVEVEKYPGFGVYDISKYALWGLTEILAIECEQKKVRVNQVSPAGVNTDMFRRAVGPDAEAPLQPEDVAEKILYFASDDSAPSTGENLMVPGL